MLNDDRNLDEVKKALAEREAETGDVRVRPELRGYTREAKLLTQIAAKIVALHRSQTRNLSIPMPEEPMFPAERIKLQEKSEEVDLLWSTVFAAMKNPGR